MRGEEVETRVSDNMVRVLRENRKPILEAEHVMGLTYEGCSL